MKSITVTEWMNIYRGWATLYPHQARYWLDGWLAQWKYDDAGCHRIPDEERKHEQLNAS